MHGNFHAPELARMTAMVRTLDTNTHQCGKIRCQHTKRIHYAYSALFSDSIKLQKRNKPLLLPFFLIFCSWLLAMLRFSSFFTVDQVLSRNLLFQVAGETAGGHVAGAGAVKTFIWGSSAPLAVIECVPTPKNTLPPKSHHPWGGLVTPN